MAFKSKYKGAEIEGILDYASGGMDNMKRVYWSGVRVNNPTVIQRSIRPDAIDLATDGNGKEFFVARYGTEYYGGWPTQTDYQTGAEAGAEFLNGVVYVSDTEILVSSQDKKSLMTVSGSEKVKVWKFKHLNGLKTSSTNDEIVAALGVGDVSELCDMAKTHLFVNMSGDINSDANVEYVPCNVVYKGYDRRISIIVDDISLRTVITFNLQTLNHIESISSINMVNPAVVDNLNSTSKTDALSANMGNRLSQACNGLSGSIASLFQWQNTIESWKKTMPDTICIALPGLTVNQEITPDFKLSSGQLAIYWIAANFQRQNEVSTPIIGTYNNMLANVRVPVTMGNGTRLTVSVGGMNEYAKSFRVYNSSGQDVTSSYRLYGIVFGTK